MRAGGLNKWYAQYVSIANIDAVDLTERRQLVTRRGRFRFKTKVTGQ